MSIRTNRIKTSDWTKVCIAAGEGHVGATAGAVMNTDNGVVTIPNAVTAGTFVLPISNLHVGDTIMAYRVLGATPGAAAKTIAATLYKHTVSAASITASSVSAATSDTTATAHALNIYKELATPETVTTLYDYFILVTVTTNGAGTSVELTGAEVYVKKTLGQTS